MIPTSPDPPRALHTIICGSSGPVPYLIDELEAALQRVEQRGPDRTGTLAREYVVVSPDQGHLQDLARQHQHLHWVAGDPTEDEVLQAAGVAGAYGIYALLRHEKDNLFITLTARQLNPGIRIVAGADDPPAVEAKLRRAGADAVISPNALGGLRLVSELARPKVTAFLDRMLRSTEEGPLLREATVDRASPLCGARLIDLALPARLRVLVLALRRAGTAQTQYNPRAGHRVEAGDTLVLFGEEPQLTLALEAATGQRSELPETVPSV